MANFWTDLNRHINDYEAAEAADEAERAMRAGESEWHMYGEDAVRLPSTVVNEPEQDTWRYLGEGTFRYVASQDGDPWGR